MNKKYSFLLLFEGAAKFNLIFFLVALIFMYFGKTTTDQIYQMYEEQITIIFFSLLFGKIYQKISHYKFFSKEIKLQYLLLGYSMYIGLYLLVEYLFAEVDEAEIKSKFISLIVGYVYWFTCLWLARSDFMSKIIHFLHGTLDYKNLWQLFLMFNLAFFVLILVMLSVGMVAGRSLFESLFVILYIELSFLVFHIVVAKAVDYIWNEKNFDHQKISVMGLYCSSILYVVKLNLIDENLINIGHTRDNMSLFGVLTLMLFWTFFVVLFHFEMKYPIRRKKS